MMDSTQQPYGYENSTGAGAHKRVKIAGTVALAIALLAGITVGIVLTHNEAENQASAVVETTGQVAITMGGSVSPQSITVKKGQSVTWTNQDGRRNRQIAPADDTMSQSLKGFGTAEPLTKGETYSYAFQQVGTYHYYDPTSSQTIGTVIVTQ
jgi:plastocyanin